ncbi:C25 family cysteine peptidase [Flavobacterium sp.]|jgi:gingipain R|uniref:C25 family cysteine peptidase n=1 Tax=Flavobacterium sp. TaxID=239 RepID=UPI0022BD7023|nr:C25 family cysteine peptidase [Flavobacterium sp.]MCZ8145850.1 C25 family cysteine peptidase [Flavobacterium sp.]MCZ8366436.1 C25 family cysteine peptidase [Flavobacterium sp.]
MKKIQLFLCCLGIFGSLQAQQIRLVASQGDDLTLQNQTPVFQSLSTIVAGKAYVDFSQVAKVFTMQKGAPAVPVFTESVQVPHTGAVTFTITHDGFIEYTGVSVLPSKGSLKRNVDPAKVPFVFGPEYSQNAFYPGTLAHMSDPFVFRSTRGATISFYPYQYNPVTQTLRVYQNIRVRVTTQPQQQGINEFTSQSTAVPQEFQRMYEQVFINTPQYLPVSEHGDMLVITPSAYVNTLQPWVQWKIESGMKTTVATLAQTGTTAASIKSFVASFYAANPSLVYVMLVGDHQHLPSFSYGTSIEQEELWSDSYYGQLDGTDFFPEVLVGRFSGSVSEVQTMVNRTLEYETNPLTGDWMTKAIGIGSDEGDGYGDDGEPDWLHLRNIRALLLTNGYTTVHEFYDGSQGGNDAAGSPSSSMISSALNQGAGLLNYTGHGWTQGVSTGDYTSGDVSALVNNGKYPFVVSVACNNGTFVGETAFCETFTRLQNQGSPAGAIAACGSSILMAWAEPMQTQDEMAELIIRSDSDNIKTTLGGLFYNGQVSMLETYNQSMTAEEVMQTWIFFGDPSTLFRNKVTTNLTATHVATMSASGGLLEVFSPHNGARVAITQNDQILGTALISNGVAVFNLPPFTTLDTVKVTLTLSNAKPYQGIITLNTLGVATVSQSFQVYPNPSNEVVYISAIGSTLTQANLQLVDAIGRVCYTQDSVNLTEAFPVPVASLASGSYLLVIRHESGTSVHKIQVN